MLCHTGNIFIFRDPGSKLEFYGAGETKNGVWDFSNMVLVDFGCNLNPLVQVEGLKLERSYISYKRIKVNVGKDLSVLNFQWWNDFLEDLRGIDNNYVLFMNKDGHGVVGVGLAIMSYLTGFEKVDPVGLVQRKYCSVVFKKKDIEFVNNILGLKKI